MTRLLDDQPANRAGDKLRFNRTLAVIERLVLMPRVGDGKPKSPPFVVGLFGRWGSGKSTLLKILADHLEDENNKVRQEHPAARYSLLWQMLPKTWLKRLGFLADPVLFHQPWIVVDFSPWRYRNQSSLLIPLLATLAKKQPQLWQLIREIAGMNTGWISTFITKLVGTGGFSPETFAAAQTALPVLALLQNLNEKAKKSKEAKDLAEQIADAVKEITNHKTRLVFLIDDLVRCHDPAQIVGLLEQIKLFLHLDNCLFFIAADRGQIVQAINTKFPGEGERYLEKFVQLTIELPQSDGTNLLELLPDASAEDRACFKRAAEVLGHNPRKLKALWNRAQTCLALLQEDLQGVTGLNHKPSLPLMVRWLLISEAGLFEEYPYAMLELEHILLLRPLPDLDARKRFDALLATHSSRSKSNSNNQSGSSEPAKPDVQREHLRRQLTVYLWHDRHIRFESPSVLTLYLKATGMAHKVTRQWLEHQLFDGETEFDSVDFRRNDLREARLSDVTFSSCDFSGVDLSGADLMAVKFNRCNFADAKFDGCTFANVEWFHCKGLQALETEPETYEKLADLLVRQWERDPGGPPMAPDGADGLNALYKTYTRAYSILEALGGGSEEQKNRLLKKSSEVREMVKQATMKGNGYLLAGSSKSPL